LLPRAEKARDIVPDTLRARGAALTVATAYKTVRPSHADTSIKEDILNDRYDLITFSSSSTFENFVALFTTEEFARIAPSLKAVSIGPLTTAAIRRFGITPLIEARQHTIPGLVASIREYLQK